MWPFNLSVRLPIADLVGRYPTNYLIGREAILQRIAPLVPKRCLSETLCGISSRFQLLYPSERQVDHTLLTRPPLTRPRRDLSVRLACVRHAASVRPEPGSNSLKNCINTHSCVPIFLKLLALFVRYSSVSLLTSLEVRIFTVAISCFSKKSQGFLFYRCLIFKVRFRSLKPLSFSPLS